MLLCDDPAGWVASRSELGSTTQNTETDEAAGSPRSADEEKERDDWALGSRMAKGISQSVSHTDAEWQGQLTSSAETCWRWDQVRKTEPRNETAEL